LGSYRGFMGECVSSLQPIAASLQRGALWLRLSARLELARAPRVLSSLPFGALSKVVSLPFGALSGAFSPNPGEGARSFVMNTASKLGPHTQTDRGTYPGVGL